MHYNRLFFAEAFTFDELSKACADHLNNVVFTLWADPLLGRKELAILEFHHILRVIEKWQNIQTHPSLEASALLRDYQHMHFAKYCEEDALSFFRSHSQKKNSTKGD